MKIIPFENSSETYIQMAEKEGKLLLSQMFSYFGDTKSEDLNFILNILTFALVILAEMKMDKKNYPSYCKTITQLLEKNLNLEKN